MSFLSSCLIFSIIDASQSFMPIFEAIALAKGMLLLQVMIFIFAKLIYYLTKFLENLVFKFSNYSTTVSIKEKNKILKLYKKNTVIYPNAIDINEKRIKKN